MKLSKAEITVIVITVLFIAAAVITTMWNSDESAAVTILEQRQTGAEDTDLQAHYSENPGSSPLVSVNINTAAAQELCSIPGIGEALAGRIIAYREEHGLFKSTDEIMSVSGIGAKTYEEIEGYITVQAEKREVQK